ncbi:MAG: hypothetical protein LUD22_02205 [Coprobacillus sp.]|nr:hypothetical protein [Coprobacillus sp.]
MKKKRLGAISLLFVLALSLGACDDLDDILSSTTGGDTSGEQSEDIGGGAQNPGDDEDPNAGVNPNDDENDDGNNDNDDEDENDEGNSDDPNQPSGPIEVISYELAITNKEDLASEWKVTGESQTLEVSLYTVTTIDNVETSRVSEAGDATSVTLEATSTDDGSVTTSGLTIYPATTGSVTITATWNDHIEAYDTYSVLITEDKEYEYSLSIDNKDSFTFSGEEEDVWKVGDSALPLSVSLTTKELTYTAPTDPEETTNSIDAEASQVLISAINTDTGVSEDVVSVNGLSLTPVGAGTALVTVSWIDHPEASDSFTVTVSEADRVTYKLSISNSEDLQAKWYIDDEPRNLEIAITPSDESTTVDVTSLIQESKISVTPVVQGVVDVSIDITSGTITLTPVSSGTTWINVAWSEYTEATATIKIDISLHSYVIAIDNINELTSTWYIEEENSRTATISLTKDDVSVEISTLSEGHIGLVAGGDDASAVNISDLTITAVSEGAPTITAVWYSSDEDVLAESEPITLDLNGYVKVTGITLDNNELNLEYGGTGTITVTLTGQNDKTPTNTEVSWESSDSAVTVTPDSTDSRVATVTGNKEATGVTITATALGGTDITATCTVSVAAKELTAFKVIDGSAKPTVVDTPDDNGVYVIADESFTSYIGYSSSFSIVETYDDAIGVRTIPTDSEGSYILEINGQYLSSSLSLVSSIDEAEAFAVTSSGITGLYVTTSGLDSSGDMPAHLIDYTYYEHEDTTTGGEYYLYGVYKDYDYNSYMTGAVASNKLSTTDLLLEAAKVTVTQENDAIYMTYNDKYLSVSGSDPNVTFNTTKAPTYYDSTNDVWQSSDGSRYLATNLGNSLVVFGSYQYSSGSLNSQYAGVYLYNMDKLPIEKGISLSATEYELVEDSSTATQIKYYPSCDTDFEPSDIAWSQSSVDGGAVTINESNGVILATSAGTVVVTATLGHTPALSHSITLEIKANESGYKTLTYSYTFVKDDLSNIGGTKQFGNLTWTFDTFSGGQWDGSNNRGYQIGTSNTAQTTPVTFTTDLGEEVTLTSFTLGACCASSGSASYTISIGSSKDNLTNSFGGSLSVSTSGPLDNTHTDLDYTGQVIQISMVASSKAMYISSISFTVVVSVDSALVL